MPMTTNSALFEYCLRLGDNSLILGHRLSEWCGHAPVLEQDIALINVALDLVGQATNLLEYAAVVENKGRTADDLAFLRDSYHFRNATLVEQPNGDFACTIVRQYLYDTFHYHLYQQLTHSKDATLAAIAEKSIKEISYHVRHSGEWFVRLGDGTEESRSRMQNALNELWMFTGDLFIMDEVDQVLLKENIAVDLNAIKKLWLEQISAQVQRATLTLPSSTYMLTGGKEGKHTEHLSILLAEMQVLQRTYPGAQW